MLAEDRRNKIVNILCQKNSISVNELSGLFNVAKVTIRRDLEKLER